MIRENNFIIESNGFAIIDLGATLDLGLEGGATGLDDDYCVYVAPSKDENDQETASCERLRQMCDIRLGGNHQIV